MVKLLDITGKAISGEWGTDCDHQDGIPVLRTTNFRNNGTINYDNVVIRNIIKDVKNKFLCYGDIIIEKSGGSDKQPVGRVVYFDGKGNRYLFNNFTGVLRVKNTDRWNPKYIFYALFAAYKRGETRRFENRTTCLHNLQLDSYVKNFNIQEISITYQNKICDILDNIHHQIILREKELTHLDDLVKARFVEMFEGGENQWGQKKLVECCNNKNDIKCGPFGSQLHVEDYQNVGIPVYGIPEVNSGFKTNPKLYVSRLKAEELSSYNLIPGDVAVSRKGNVGQAALFHDELKNGIIHSDVLRIRLNEQILNPLFLIGELHFSQGIRNQVMQASSGAIMPGTNVTKLKKIIIDVPPLSMQMKYSTLVQQVEKSKVAIDHGVILIRKALQSGYHNVWGN